MGTFFLTSMPLRPTSLNFRSYGQQQQLHAHEHVQIVLPVLGELEIEVEGTAERVHRGAGILLVPGRMHDQFARGTNRFLIVDCDPALIDPKRLNSIAKRPTLPVSEAAHRLVQFAYLSASRQGAVMPKLSEHILPLLLETLLAQAQTPASRLSSLLHDIDSSLGRPWTTADMARAHGVSECRLHAQFQTQLGTTPQLWLTEARLRRAQYLLAQSLLPIADIALQLGYSDQTALTRAMKRELNATPAAYRRLHQR